MVGIADLPFEQEVLVEPDPSSSQQNMLLILANSWANVCMFHAVVWTWTDGWFWEKEYLDSSM